MIFYFLFFIFYIFLSWFKPRHALYLTLFLLPTYQIKFSFVGIPFTFLELMILILFMVWLIKRFNNLTIKRFNNLLSGWRWLICLWLLVATISMFVAPELRAAAGVWRAYFIEPAMFLIVLLDLIKNDQDKKTLIFTLGLSAFCCSVWAILQKWLGGGVFSTEVWGRAQVWRATGPFSHPNFLGLYLAPLIVLVAGGIVNFRGKIRSVVCCFVFLFITFWALVLARSEGALIGVFAGLAFWGVVLKKTRKYVLTGLIIAFLLIMVWPFSRQYFLEKALLQDLSGQFRLNIWSGAVSLLKVSPVLGAGLDGYERLIPDYQANSFIARDGRNFYAPPQPYPHNLFLAIWLEVGLVGLIVFVWILIRFFKQGFKNLENRDIILNGAVMGAMVCILVHGLVDTPYFKNDLAVVFWLIIGLRIVLKDNYENQISNN
ncbi:MAG: O-antigen ligase family protein [Patescibacteria group bacterium]|nr:O-antigen ligase family protein [Patescibacteria group bacterium]